MSEPPVESPIEPDVEPRGELREPRHRVAPKARMLWTVIAVANALFWVVLGGGVAYFDWLTLPWWVWAAYAVGALAYVVAMPLLRYRTHRWETTETAVYTQTGFLARNRSIAPMSRVQTVDFAQGPIERSFGLASVTVNTASSAGALSIKGLDRPIAEQLVADLTRRAELEQDDAT